MKAYKKISTRLRRMTLLL